MRQESTKVRVKFCFKDSIRIVRIAKDDNLQALRSKARETYAELQQAAEVLFKYQDTEGDDISVATDDDLELAFETNPSPLKFFLQATFNEVNSQKRVCTFFSRGFCKYGEHCKFLHSSDGSPGPRSSTRGSMTGFQTERWLTSQLQASAADNIEQLSSTQGLEMLHNIAQSEHISHKAATMLVTLLTKEEIRSSMMKQVTNKIYGLLMGTRFIGQLQVQLNSLYPPTVQSIQPYLLLIEELQLRTSTGWKSLPLDALNALVQALPESPSRSELAGKVTALLEQRRRLQLLSAISSPDPGLQGPDFRNLPIIPSKEELLMIDNPVLPVNKVDVRYGSVNEYLETHFRLLREDFIEPLRTGIRAKKDVKQASEVQVYTNVRLVAMKFSSNGIESKVSFATEKKKIDWEGTKRLMFGSLLCMSRDNFDSIIWATVAGRSNIAKRQVEIQLLDGNELEAMQNYIMVESTTAYYEAYSHVLQSLQRADMEKVPFTEHLISLEREVKEPEYLMQREAHDMYNIGSTFPEMATQLGESEFHVLQRWPEWTSTLDASQKLALKHGLTKRLALIQGPPGTGKTFLGLLLVDILLNNLKKQKAPAPSSSSKAHDVSFELQGPILVVCYTNHALDQFLTGIYRKEENLIRIGGRCKSQVLEGRNLRKLIQRSWEGHNVMGAHARASGMSRARRQTLEKQIELCVDILNMQYVDEKSLHGVATEEQIANLFYERNSNVKNWLKTEPFQYQYQNVVQRAGRFAILNEDMNSPSDSEEEVDVEAGMPPEDEILEENIEEPDDPVEEPGRGWIRVARRPKRSAAPPPHVAEAPLPLHMFVDETDVWQLAREARERLHDYWLEEIHANAQRDLTRLKFEYADACKQQKEADSEIQLSLLRGAKVIGMTTTAAARLHDLLVSLKPEIVIVEEAAEVLEAHILASLSPHTKHLILIGDHLQLRPSVATYKLAVKHRLDVSLFERLVSSGVDHVMLEVQRRMRPSVSKLISTIYPTLKDHPSVQSYEEVKGMKSSLFFMDHRAPEETGLETGSKVNIPEAEMVVGLCNYLLNQNCYTSENITILAMYKGQVREIIRRLRERLRYHERAPTRLGSIAASEFPENIMPRVSSVDDFQGEESDVILLSLVRSNAIASKGGSGKIGFLATQNRVCVALSRARKGLYIFGDAQLLSNKNPLWRSVTQMLNEDGAIGPRLLLRCQNHPDVETNIGHAHDFYQVADGGCTKPCEYQLSCGHVCPRRCHPVGHVGVICPKRCLKPLECSHRCNKLCHGGENDDCPPCEVPVMKTIPRCGHKQQLECSEDEARATCLNPCDKLLPCGHQCTNVCGRPCPMLCHKEVVKSLPCGHKKRMPCFKPSESLCTEPCQGLLPGCEHRCSGTCGKCKQGTDHVPCKHKCRRDLPCGHQCGDSCSAACPPCKKHCEKRCLHSKCSLKCGELCKSCLEPCSWKCAHFKCGLLCYEVCKRPRCNERCSSTMKCGHPCIGLCGEPCPSKCRHCDPKTLDVISQMTLAECDADDLFIELLDCCHIFEVSGLDQWMDMDDSVENGGSKAIKLKSCPACRTPIRRSFRYANVVKRKLQQIEEVKKKIYGYDIVRLAFEKLNKNEIEAARDLFREAITIQPGLLEAHFGMGVTLCSMKEFRPAITHLQLIVEKSSFAAKVRLPDVPLKQPYHPLPVNVVAGTTKASDQLATKALVQLASALTGIRRFTEAAEICEVVLKHDKDNKNAQTIKRMAVRKMTLQVVDALMPEFGGTSGHWFQCPNGHIYAIGECGGAMERSRCPDCGELIGGGGHRLAEGNQHSSVDGSSHAFYDPMTGLGNLNIADLQR